MIYFDNAATGGRKPACVTGAVHAAVDGLCANPGRGGHAAALALAERVYECRGLLAAFFGAADASAVGSGMDASTVGSAAGASGIVSATALSAASPVSLRYSSMYFSAD